MRKQLTMTTAMAAALLALPACSSRNDDWEAVTDRDTAVCVDKDGKRVDDRQCNPQARGAYGGGGGGMSNAFLWYYLGRNSAVPFYGDSIRDPRYAGRGSFTPTQGVRYADAPRASRMTRSQAVSRGGLGSRGRSFGSGRS
ncbi:hypothetical protein LQ953_03000 [Sphingomonas sp. IC-56]|uniref:hypothetical protein n=1 Tax=Sphingomonas sp. IC-56 TaxID=2898529 RepID=UPI001E36ED98|nr:hypothetical protein [Sphingomonas sp. IC-56]MCD2322982.1 hypothetical protein [Sphingomonas sp. IC-56]